MSPTIILRRALPADLDAVDRLLQRSYPRLLARDYPPSVLVTALPIISRARPELLSSGTYYLATDGDGAVLGAGGWSREAPSAREDGEAGMAHIRHVATDPAHLRRGIGRAILSHALAEAAAAGFRWVDCLSTRTAQPFYEAMGFRAVYPVDVPLRPGIVFPAIRMIRGPED